jgi:hypothetical protein
MAEMATTTLFIKSLEAEAPSQLAVAWLISSPDFDKVTKFLLKKSLVSHTATLIQPYPVSRKEIDGIDSMIVNMKGNGNRDMYQSGEQDRVSPVCVFSWI